MLTVHGTPHPVGPLSPCVFSGDSVTDCRPEAGALRNMNVMTCRSRATADVRIITVAAAWAAEMEHAAGRRYSSWPSPRGSPSAG